MKIFKLIVVFVFLLSFSLSIYQNMNLYDSMRSNQFFKTRYDVDVLMVLKNYDVLHAWENDISLNDLIICTLKEDLEYLKADFTDNVDRILYLKSNKNILLDQIKTIEFELSGYLEKKQDIDCFDLQQNVALIRKKIKEEINQ